jgi:hypothetical protein
VRNYFLHIANKIWNFVLRIELNRCWVYLVSKVNSDSLTATSALLGYSGLLIKSLQNFEPIERFWCSKINSKSRTKYLKAKPEEKKKPILRPNGHIKATWNLFRPSNIQRWFRHLVIIPDLRSHISHFKPLGAILTLTIPGHRVTWWILMLYFRVIPCQLDKWMLLWVGNFKIDI